MSQRHDPSKNIQCVILAGGLATRMRPMTETVPKMLLEVAGKPFAHWQLSHLAKTGVTHVTLAVGYLGEKIQEYVGDGAQWGLRVNYVREGNNLLGTGGALRLILKEGKLAEQFLVTYGDSYLPIHFGDVAQAFQKSGARALMTVYRNRGQWDSSNVWWDGKRIRVYDKARSPYYAPNLDAIDYGLLAFRRDVIRAEFPTLEKADLAPVLHRLSLADELAGWESPVRFYEIGSPEGLSELSQRLAASDDGTIEATPANQDPRAPRAIILDRDGVLNRVCVHKEMGTIDSPLKVSEIELVPGIAATLAELTRDGVRLFIATNQPASAKGKVTEEELCLVHDTIVKEVEKKGAKIEESFLCLHRAEDKCSCRKPKPGMLREILDTLGPDFDPQSVWMVGDSVTDMQAAHSLGLPTVFLGPRKCDACKILETPPTLWVNTLQEAVVLWKRLQEAKGHG